jgi:predicted Fe-S protein YdhL (DUF1289 family)
VIDPAGGYCLGCFRTLDEIAAWIELDTTQRLAVWDRIAARRKAANAPTRIADWYFDFISPFAYLQSEQLDRLKPFVQIRYKPVLFAGLLKHWGRRAGRDRAQAPVHVRVRDVAGGQARHPFKMPPAHPFNPLACCGSRPPPMRARKSSMAFSASSGRTDAFPTRRSSGSS